MIERVDNAVGKEGESSKQHSDSNQPQVEQKREPHYEKFDKRDHYESSEKQSNFQQDAIHNEHFAKTVMPSTPPQFYDAALPSQPSQQPHSQVCSRIFKKNLLYFDLCFLPGWAICSDGYAATSSTTPTRA